MQHQPKCDTFNVCMYCGDKFKPDANNKDYCQKSCKLADAQRIVEKAKEAFFDFDEYDDTDSEIRNDYYKSLNL